MNSIGFPVTFHKYYKLITYSTAISLFKLVASPGFPPRRGSSNALGQRPSSLVPPPYLSHRLIPDYQPSKELKILEKQWIDGSTKRNSYIDN